MQLGRLGEEAGRGLRRVRLYMQWERSVGCSPPMEQTMRGGGGQHSGARHRQRNQIRVAVFPKRRYAVTVPNG